MTLAQAIKMRMTDLMKKKNFSQYDFYKKGGIPKATASQVLNETRERIAVKTVYEMISTMGVSLKEFFNDPIFDEVTD